MKDIHNPLFLEGTSILFVTFSLWSGGKRMPTNGSVEPLRDFLVPKVDRLDLLDQLVPGSETVLVKYETYIQHQKKPRMYIAPWWMRAMKPLLATQNVNGTQLWFKVRDFFSVLDWVFRVNRKYDLVIGLESVNTIAAILLRSLGKVKRVVYYVSDYAPNRYANRLMNYIYLWLDRYCAMHADYIWDVSLAIHRARIAAGLNKNKSAQVIHVANGVFPDQIQVKKVQSIKRHDLAYMGTVGPENGPDVAIEALAQLRKRYPAARLHIIGGTSESFAWLKPSIHALRLDSAVIHHGFVPKSKDMAQIMSACTVGLAPYRAFERSARWYGDAGKIRAYCAAGLAIVTTKVPPLGVEMAQKGAAILVEDDAEHFAEAIASVFDNIALYGTLRKHAIAYARTNTWDHQFSHAFLAMQQYEN